MELKDRLKELRITRNMTQEAVADQLGVSSQTVSKWERGLLSPDIYLLPKLAVLFRCSIDYIFDMDIAWGIEHRKEFEEKIHTLHSQQDWQGIYNAWIDEIELNPDRYSNYVDVMLHVLRKNLLDDSCVQKMISLADHAEKCCMNDDVRNEIYRIMLQICSKSQNIKIKNKAREYYNKLPMLRHSREVYAKFVMDGAEYNDQVKNNIIYTIDLAECGVRQLISSDMSLDEKLYYYKKAASLYEVVTDKEYAGVYDVPLVCDYKEIAATLIKANRIKEADEYVGHILSVMERHLSDEIRTKVSALINIDAVSNIVPMEVSCEKILRSMAKDDVFEMYREQILELHKKYTAYFSLS